MSHCLAIFGNFVLDFVYYRTAFIRFTSSLERDRHWDKLDNTHCPSNKCPYFQVEITAGDFDYTPCFTVPPDEQVRQLRINK